MSTRRGPPKHQNQYAWKPNAGRKINETEVGGKFRPLAEITGVCPRCKEQINWKRRYGKYKTLTEPAKCQSCAKRNVRQTYHKLCAGCAKEQNVCAKCRCRVDQIVGRELQEVEAEQKILEEAIKNARERDRRSLLRAMNKGKSKASERTPKVNENKVGDIFPDTSLEEYAKSGKSSKIDAQLPCEQHEADDDDVDDDTDPDDDYANGASNDEEDCVHDNEDDGEIREGNRKQSHA